MKRWRGGGPAEGAEQRQSCEGEQEKSILKAQGGKQSKEGAGLAVSQATSV